MIKHWQLFDSITNTQISQLQLANIEVSCIRTLDSQDVYIITENEKQEQFLFLMFDANRIQHIGTDYDGEHIWLRA